MPLLPVKLDEHVQQKLNWGGRWGLNPRPPESQSGALPAELRPPQCSSSPLKAVRIVRRLGKSVKRYLQQILGFIH